jgi:FixJ family two-component response regulator
MSENTSSIPEGAVVYIVDDNIPLVKALARNIEQAGYQTYCFAQAQEFLNQYRSKFVSCLLLDVRMPGMSGDQLQATLIEKGIHIPIIFMSGFADVPVVVETLKKGAVDFLTKPVEKEKLLASIHKALLLDQEHKSQDAELATIEKRRDSLTAREFEILKHIIQGKLNKIIAYDLDISIHTVENHRAKIMQKMGAKTLVGLVALCHKIGIDQDNVAEK